MGCCKAGRISARALSPGVALTAFDRLAKDGSLKEFVLYHKALALASAGDFGGAEELFAAEDECAFRRTLSRRAAVARVQILSQLGRNEDARGALEDVFGRASTPGELRRWTAQLQAGETLAFTIMPPARRTALPRCSSPSARR